MGHRRGIDLGLVAILGGVGVRWVVLLLLLRSSLIFFELDAVEKEYLE